MVVVLAIFSQTCIALYAQHFSGIDSINVTLFDQVGLQITLKSNEMSSKCGCEFNKNKKKLCNLYFAQIDHYLFIQDTCLSFDSIKEYKGYYFLIESKMDTLSVSGKVVVTAFLSPYGYFIVNSIYPLGTKFIVQKGNILCGTMPCKKVNAFDKIQYKIGFNRKKVLSRLKDMPPHDNVFWRRIQDVRQTPTLHPPQDQRQ